MSERVRRLARLQEIRRLREELDRQALELASAAVAEVELAVRTQENSHSEAAQQARSALTAGDRGEWLMADAQSEVAGWNRRGLGVLHAQRTGAVAPAKGRFLESRREHEQVKLLVEDAQQAARVEEGRRAQAASDDWFLGRRMRARRQKTMRRS
jgi:hypothetical protein